MNLRFFLLVLLLQGCGVGGDGTNTGNGGTVDTPSQNIAGPEDGFSSSKIFASAAEALGEDESTTLYIVGLPNAIVIENAKLTIKAREQEYVVNVHLDGSFVGKITANHNDTVVLSLLNSNSEIIATRTIQPDAAFDATPMPTRMGESSMAAGNSSNDPLTKFVHDNLHVNPPSIVFNIESSVSHRLEKSGDEIRLGVIHAGDIICAFDFDGTNNLPINRTRCAVWE